MSELREDLAEVEDEVARALGLDPGEMDDEELAGIGATLRIGRIDSEEDGVLGSGAASSSGSGNGNAGDEATELGIGEAEEAIENDGLERPAAAPEDEGSGEGEVPFIVDEAPYTFASRLGLAESAHQGFAFTLGPGGRNIGFIRALPSGRSITAYCKCEGHKACSRFGNVDVSFGHTLAGLIGWLSWGPDAGSAAAHKEATPDLRAMCQKSTQFGQ